ncbi:MAG: hypothetical protein Q4B54_03840 [Coriobacteriales bacterium]|nr:hypothetical protein [Coriobacteriales bacterium]
MPPSIKFSRKEIVRSAVKITRTGGIGSLTARALATELGSSTRPIFTYFDSMSSVRREVFLAAKDCYRSYVEQGLSEPIPFLGVGLSYVRFAREEPELYKLLFLEKPDDAGGGAIESLAFSQDLVRESLMHIYQMDSEQADCYFRDLWLIAFAFATLIVIDDCPYTDEQMAEVFSEVSLSICKACKEIPGFFQGDFDKDAVFKALTSGGESHGG